MYKLKGNIESSKFYHVYSRGIAKQIIFEEDDDDRFFLRLLKKYTINYNIKIIAYCLMTNHFHFLCQDSEDNLPAFMATLCGLYARYFNNKYDRVGSLFQRSYQKKHIFNDEYILTVFRYIIKNPENEGICQYQNYPWSSYNIVINENDFVDNSIIVDILGSQSVKNFLSCDTSALSTISNLVTDNEMTTHLQASKLIKAKYKIKSLSSIRYLDKQERNEAIIFLRNLGLSLRQIERFTGVSRGISQYILKK